MNGTVSTVKVRVETVSDRSTGTGWVKCKDSDQGIDNLSWVMVVVVPQVNDLLDSSKSTYVSLRLTDRVLPMSPFSSIIITTKVIYENLMTTLVPETTHCQEREVLKGQWVPLTLPGTVSSCDFPYLRVSFLKPGQTPTMSSWVGFSTQNFQFILGPCLPTSHLLVRSVFLIVCRIPFLCPTITLPGLQGLDPTYPESTRSPWGAWRPLTYVLQRKYMDTRKKPPSLPGTESNLTISPNVRGVFRTLGYNNHCFTVNLPKIYPLIKPF